ncbi:MAG: hypothetical protein AVDCRST_MAG18-3610, partial [uncultured Thermomicrobiales bacterium]
EREGRPRLARLRFRLRRGGLLWHGLAAPEDRPARLRLDPDRDHHRPGDRPAGGRTAGVRRLARARAGLATGTPRDPLRPRLRLHRAARFRVEYLRPLATPGRRRRADQQHLPADHRFPGARLPAPQRGDHAPHRHRRGADRPGGDLRHPVAAI